jgi:hypothetical protein
MFAETAIVDYRLQFVDEGKPTSVFCFCLQQRNGSLQFPFSVCRKQKEVVFSIISVCKNLETWRWRQGNMQKWRNGHGDIEQNTATQALFLNPFTICSSCKEVCSFVDEETNRSYQFANGLNGLANLCKKRCTPIVERIAPRLPFITPLSTFFFDIIANFPVYSPLPPPTLAAPV